MTEEQARQVKDPTSLPWNEAVMAFVPGRYYWGMWFIHIPPWRLFPKGGDITGQCWRFDDKPTEWIITYRFRYYAVSETCTGKDSDRKDKKSWHISRISCDEPMLETKLEQLFSGMAGLIGLTALTLPPQVERLILRGDSEKSLAILKKSKVHWLHMGASK